MRITTKEGPALVGENINGLVIDGVKTLNPIPSSATIDLKNVQKAFIYNCNVDKETAVFLRLRGDKTKNVVMRNNNLAYALKALVKDEDVQEAITVD